MKKYIFLFVSLSLLFISLQSTTKEKVTFYGSFYRLPYHIQSASNPITVLDSSYVHLIREGKNKVIFTPRSSVFKMAYKVNDTEFEMNGNVHEAKMSILRINGRRLPMEQLCKLDIKADLINHAFNYTIKVDSFSILYNYNNELKHLTSTSGKFSRKQLKALEKLSDGSLVIIDRIYAKREVTTPIYFIKDNEI